MMQQKCQHGSKHALSPKANNSKILRKVLFFVRNALIMEIMVITRLRKISSSLSAQKRTVFVKKHGLRMKHLYFLESILKHGDDWELVAQSVKTKSKLECISKLTQLPFGDGILGSQLETVIRLSGESSVKQVLPSSSPPRSEETIKVENLSHVWNVDGNFEGPPSKKQCIAGSSLLEQVACMSSTVSPHVRGAVAEAVISAVCEENQCSREVFDDYRNYTEKLIQTSTAKRSLEVDGSDTKTVASVPVAEKTFYENSVIPPTLPLRAATATALGAAAARAKLLADHEDIEIEQTIATIIDTQQTQTFRRSRVDDGEGARLDRRSRRIGYNSADKSPTESICIRSIQMTRFL